MRLPLVRNVHHNTSEEIMNGQKDQTGLGIDMLDMGDCEVEKAVVGGEGTKRRELLIKAAMEIRTEQDVAQAERLGFGPRCLVAASLPYRNPKTEQLKNGCWLRTNGNYSLLIQGGERGLPYGSYPRVFLIWLTGEAVRTKNRRIGMGRSFAEFCRKLGIDRSRGKRGAGKAMLDQIDKFLSSRAAFINHEVNGAKNITRKSLMQFSDEYTLFWDQNSPEQCTLYESEIILTEKFFQEITTHYVPLDMCAVAALKQSPLELDIYQWLAYRMYTLDKPTRPSWEQLYVQFGSSYKEEDLRFFKRDFIKALKAVTTVYPWVKLNVENDGLLLLPSPTPVNKTKLVLLGNKK